MRFDILSLTPDYFKGPFDVSILKKARERGVIDLRLVDIRSFADNKHAKVDDRPYGGGPGMVLMPQPVCGAIRSVKSEESHVIYLTPQGKKLTAHRCQELAHFHHLVLVCGHYEGIDERAIEAEVDEEISIGDYVMTNGCSAAIVVVDAVSRFVPGVLGDDDSAKQDSFQDGILDAPHYTRPEVFEGREVPAVLKSGNHLEIAKWRHSQAMKKTTTVRPDLLKEN